MDTHPEPPHPSRRSLLQWATHGLGAIFAAILGFPVVCYLIDPLNRSGGVSGFRPVSGVRLSEVGDAPVQGVIRNPRSDAWTRYPDDVVGRVWIHREKPGNEKDCFQVFTTTCPHLGCFVNCNPDQLENPGFTCPCHDGKFNLDGSRKPNTEIYSNPAPRGMDTLEFDVARDPENPDPSNRDRLLVKFEFFKQATEEKIRRT